ncbi:MAG: 4-alpha-glucanotransferase [Lachnospiraceae bacterium]|nr:4-alpha-glucanotransferase [Lachnospiraceae bacterium]
MERTAGILLPVFALPSKCGIGSFSKEAYAFVDFLEKAGQGAWQVLPLGPTAYGNSPYQPVSAFAGNPFFISLEDLEEEGYLTKDEIEGEFFGNDQDRVDYGAVHYALPKLLKIACGRFFEQGMQRQGEYTAFVKKAAAWLPDYAMYMALKETHEGKSWDTWEDSFRVRNEEAIGKAELSLQDTIVYYYFEQFMFHKQWNALKTYANKKRVKIIGDVPFYVAYDSADVWAHPEVFKLDADFKPICVAGCPPDAFSPRGQRWGNPIYDWKYLKQGDYDWWMQRLKRNFELFDVLRIDHFHGFAEYYEIPASDETAENGIMIKGPGMDLVERIVRTYGKDAVIAENLGNQTPINEKLLAESGFAGMNVLQYAFTSWDSCYLTHRHEKNSVVYTGTHDNTPVRAWVEEIGNDDRDFARAYIGSVHTDYGQFTWDFIREAYRSVANLSIVPLQDYMVFGADTRINFPGRTGDNWVFRLRPGSLSEALCMSIRRLSEVYGRVPRREEE